VACSATEVAYSIVAIVAIIATKILLAQVRVDVISEIRDVWHIVIERAEGEPIMPFATRLRLHIGSQTTPGISETASSKFQLQRRGRLPGGRPVTHYSHNDNDIPHNQYCFRTNGSSSALKTIVNINSCCLNSEQQD